MNTQSYPATFRNSADECVGVGDFIYDETRTHLYIVLPREGGGFQADSQGRAVLDCIPLQGSPHPRKWSWDGNTQKPTLNPSIDLKGHWHGYLRNGVLQSC